MLEEMINEVVLYSDQHKAIHVLNATARLIWSLCDGEHTLEEMEMAIRSNFSVPVEYDVRADIQRTLEELASQKLLIENSSSQSE